MSQLSKKLLTLAGIGVILSSSSISSASTRQKPTNPGNRTVVVQGANASFNEAGEWEVMVDTEKGTINTRQLSGKPGIKVAAILGLDSGVNGSQLGSTVYNNTALVTNGTNTFASASMKIQISNNTGATLGKPTATGVTGVRLMLMPYTAAECTPGATTLQQPICVVTNTSTKLPATGASGLNNGTNPVYLAYITPRDGSNLSATDDTSPVEWNEATGYTSATDYARTVWQPTLTIANGAKATFGMRFRYAQDAPGSGQPRVTNFLYKFRVLATRTNGKAITPSNAYVTTVAGSTQNFSDGTGSTAKFNTPFGVAISSDGSTLYVADQLNNRIRKIVAATGVVTTLAGSTTSGSADGTGSAAQFKSPSSVAISPDSSTLYVVDTGNHSIRKIVAATGVVTTLAGSATPGFADGSGSAAQFNTPLGVTISPDPAGSILYVADRFNHRIRKIDVVTGVVTTLAGSTQGFADTSDSTPAQFNNPYGITISPNGSILYVADRLNHSIRKIVAATGVVTTLAGSATPGFADATGTNAQFNNPYGVAISPDGSTLYVADPGNKRIRNIEAATGVVTTLATLAAGFADGTVTTAKATLPTGVAISPEGTTIYVVDQLNHRIRQIQAVEGQ